MGTSHPETKPWVIAHIHQARALWVLDVGAGAGNWLDALRAHGYTGNVVACEVWEPYIHDYSLDLRYTAVMRRDARDLTAADFARFDVVIFGDVLEHMTKAEAQTMWERAQAARHAAIAIPIVHYCQGALNGNPHEEHVKPDWSHDEVLASFPGIAESQVFTVTGAYWR